MIKDLLDRQRTELNELNRHRSKWLFLSIIVISTIIFIIVDWSDLREQKMLWILGSLGLLLSAVWWYWTMRMVRILISHKYTETEILKELYNDVKEVRAEVKKISSKD